MPKLHLATLSTPSGNHNLVRFLDAQNHVYLKALAEIRRGRKESHWMWFIFPQIKGLGSSDNAKFYGIANLQEAAAFLAHPVLGKHLTEISQEVLDIHGKTALDIFGTPDDLKLRSCMTLFSKVPEASDVFQKVLNEYFDGLPDHTTLELIQSIIPE